MGIFHPACSQAVLDLSKQGRAPETSIGVFDRRAALGRETATGQNANDLGFLTIEDRCAVASVVDHRMGRDLVRFRPQWLSPIEYRESLRIAASISPSF